MGVARDSRHKRRHTGGRRKVHVKKRKFELARQAAMTKLAQGSEQRIRVIRTMGGNRKFRALKLDHGNFSWGSEVCTRKTRILNVVYNASSNELVRTNTLVKGCIVEVDATPFKQWYEKHYEVKIGSGLSKKKASSGEAIEVKKRSSSARSKMNKRKKEAGIAREIEEQLLGGRVLCRISSRPGQCGRADGYFIEGEEYQFYNRMLNVGKKK
eukprot:g663.t1